MSEQEINRAIARIALPNHEKWTERDFERGWRSLSRPEDPICDTDEQTIPNYVNDLNAIHEAIGTLESRYWAMFMRELSVATKTDLEVNSLTSVMLQTNATARQRAEAFLKTIEQATTPTPRGEIGR